MYLVHDLKFEMASGGYWLHLLTVLMQISGQTQGSCDQTPLAVMLPMDNIASGLTQIHDSVLSSEPDDILVLPI